MSQATVTIGFLNNKDMIRIFSQGIISQVSIYVMDVVWVLSDFYVWRSEFNRGSYGFVKLPPEFIM